MEADRYYTVDEKGVPYQVSEEEWWGLNTPLPLRDMTYEMGGVTVETTCEMVNPKLDEDGNPLIWITTIVGGAHHHYRLKASSRRDAIANHKTAKLIAFLP